MSKIFTTAKLQVIAYRMAIVKFCFFTLVSLSSAIIGALTNVNWKDMDYQAKFLMLLTIFVVWGNTMMAFFTSATNRIQQDLGDKQDTGVEVSQTTTINK